MRLHRTILFVKDLPCMADFYGQVLGLDVISGTQTGDWAEFDAGGTVLALHAIPAHIAKDIDISSPPKSREDSPVKLCFAVDDIPLARARLQSLGVRFRESPWGYCEGLDPEGNLFQLCDS